VSKGSPTDQQNDGTFFKERYMTVAEAARQVQRDLRGDQRSLEREKADLQRKEKEIVRPVLKLLFFRFD
jgi:hypothetical protein